MKLKLKLGLAIVYDGDDDPAILEIEFFTILKAGW